MALTVPTILPDDFPRPTIPAGGSPQTDRDYLAWRDAVVSDLESRAVAYLWHTLADWPGLPAWRFDWILLARLGLDDPMFPLIYHHRIRLLGIALRDRRRECERIAASICLESSTWH